LANQGAYSQPVGQLIVARLTQSSF
jgi:hypothetical protein